MFINPFKFSLKPTRKTGKEKLESLFDTFGWNQMTRKDKPSARDRSPTQSIGRGGKKRKW